MFDQSKNVEARLWSLYFKDEFGIQPNVGMDIGLMANVLDLVTMSEECIEKKNGRFEKVAYAFGCMYHLVRNCHLPELFSFPSRQS